VTTNGDQTYRVVPVRHYGRWVAAAVIAVLTAMVVHTVFSKIPTGQVACSTGNGVRLCHPIMEWRFGWDVVFQYFTSALMVKGLLITIELTLIAMLIGIVLGVLVAIMRLSPNRLLSIPAWIYTWFFRGTPVYVQLLFWFNFAALYKTIVLGVPFASAHFFTFNTLNITAFVAATIGLGLNEAAYMSEIARAGLISVDEGQIEAATALGMTRAQTLRLVILPQAMRVILPPTGNEVISMLKTTSLAASIGVLELTGAAQNIYASNYKIMDLLICASLWYIIMTTILSIGQYYVERHFGRGALRNQPLTPIERLRRDVRGIAGKMHTSRPGVAQ
jgi:polar amino acid transport system permease protein